MERLSKSKRLSVLVASLVGAAGTLTLAVIPQARLVPSASLLSAGPTVGSSTTPAINLCGIANPEGSGPGAFETPAVHTGTLVSGDPTTTIYPTSQLGAFYYDSSNGDVYVKTSTSIVVTTTSGAVLNTFSLPQQTLSGQPISTGTGDTLLVDPSGDMYFVIGVGSGSDLVELSPTGTQEWDDVLAGWVSGLFAWHDSSGDWAAAVVGDNSELVMPSGAQANGTEPIPASLLSPSPLWATPTPSGGLVFDTSFDTGAYIHQITSSGAPVAPSQSGVPAFGDPNGPNADNTPGAPFTFFQIGGVVDSGSTIYISEGRRGIDVFSPTGVYEGTVPASTLDNIGVQSSLYYDPTDATLLIADEHGVASVPTSTIQKILDTASPPTQNGFGDTLGIGAGLTTNATAGYFPSGATPTVTASFDPWWQDYPDPLELSYWVANGPAVTANDLPASTVVPLSWGGVSSGSPLEIPLTVPSVPGVYLVNADLLDTTTGTTIGSTCLTYSVGMPGDTLDFSTLSPGESFGGPAPERGVELAAALGTGDMREQLDLGTLLPNCAASPSEATCGPGALTNWSSYDPATEAAAAKAKSLGVNFEVQVAQASAPTDQAVIQDGYWQADVEAIVEHFHTSAPDLTDVEAFNEPNTSSYLTPATYVSECLQPFYQAVQAANAADGTNVQVIGGTVVGMDVSGWWAGIGAAGGFSYMNIAGIHPYPGYNRSFEEQGTPQMIEQLRQLMGTYHVGSMPIWDTEQGWWSDGEEDFYDVGNWAPREWMWLKALGVESWDYFITEGGFSGFGTDFSLIEAGGADSYLKPGAIGLMTVSNLLGDRPFIRQVSLGIPHAYGMLFGPPSNGSATNDILAVWTDDLDVQGQVTLSSGSGNVTITTTGSLGEPGSLTVSPSAPTPIALSGAPTYLSVPAGDTISVGPAESYGPNLALASSGATASASSTQAGWSGPSAVISGSANGSISPWTSEEGDNAPWVQVNLPSPETIDRVIVSTSSIGSTMPGLRDYTVELDENGTWTTVGTVTNEFFNRMEQLSFPPATSVTGIKVLVTALDYNSELGGLPPDYWPSNQGQTAVVYSVEAYAPGVVGTTSTSTPSTTTSTTLDSAPGTPAGSSQVLPASPPATSAATTTTTAVPPSDVHGPTTTQAVATTTLPQRVARHGVTTTTSPKPRQPVKVPVTATSTTLAKAGATGIPVRVVGTSRPAKRQLVSTELLFVKRVVVGRSGAVTTRVGISVTLHGKHGTPTGTVMVTYGSWELCHAKLENGSASCWLSALRYKLLSGAVRVRSGSATGLSRLTIRYAGDGPYMALHNRISKVKLKAALSNTRACSDRAVGTDQQCDGNKLTRPAHTRPAHTRPAHTRPAHTR